MAGAAAAVVKQEVVHDKRASSGGASQRLKPGAEVSLFLDIAHNWRVYYLLDLCMYAIMDLARYDEDCICCYYLSVFKKILL